MKRSYTGAFIICFLVFLTFWYRFGISFTSEKQEESVEVYQGKIVMKRFSFQRDLHESKFQAFEGNSSISYQRAMELLCSASDFEFQDELSNVILTFAQEQAVFWECVPINIDTYSSQPFEFMLLPAPSLTKRNVDPKPFTQQFRDLLSPTDHYPVISFENLGRDARLVVPGPAIDIRTNEHVVEPYYTHLSSFLLRALPDHRRQFWRVLGNTFDDNMKRLLEQRNHRPIWLSTSGLGVSWLHVRIDTVSKYYNYQPYKQFHPASH